MWKRRRRFKQVETLHDRLATWANRLREQADKLPDGPERDALLTKLRQADTASRIDGWANSPGLQPPTKSRGSPAGEQNPRSP
jgi:hypothetical protein